MNRWEALVAIVKAFADKDQFAYAFGVCLILGLPIVVGLSAVIIRVLK